MQDQEDINKDIGKLLDRLTSEEINKSKDTEVHVLSEAVDSSKEENKINVKSVEIVPLKYDLNKIVNFLTNEPTFLENVDKFINTVIKNNKLDSSNIPELIFLMMDSYNNLDKSLTYKNLVHKEDLESFVRLVFEFIVNKYKLLPDNMISDYETVIIASIKLLLLTPKVNIKVNKLSETLRNLFKCC